MTTGEYLSSISTVSNVSALTHLINPSGTGGVGDIIYIKSFKVSVETMPTNVYVRTNNYKLVFPTIKYKVVYTPKPISATRVADNVIIKKGC